MLNRSFITHVLWSYIRTLGYWHFMDLGIEKIRCFWCCFHYVIGIWAEVGFSLGLFEICGGSQVDLECALLWQYWSCYLSNRKASLLCRVAFWGKIESSFWTITSRTSALIHEFLSSESSCSFAENMAFFLFDISKTRVTINSWLIESRTR